MNNAVERELNANLPREILRARLRDKIEHLTKRMRDMRRDSGSMKLLSAAKGELAVAKRRLAKLNEPAAHVGSE